MNVMSGCACGKAGGWLSSFPSSPSSMAASKIADFWGALPGHAVQYSDAEMAYTQAI